MLPTHSLPDPNTFTLPWHLSGAEWYDALNAQLCALEPVKGIGRYALGYPSRSRPHWKRFPRPTLRLKRRHKSLFAVSRHTTTCFDLPSAELLRELAARPLLEVGSGSGAWGLLLAAAGGDIVTTDPRPWPMGGSYDHRDRQEDHPFSVRQRRSRASAGVWSFNTVRKPYPGTLTPQTTRFSLSRAAPAQMSFSKAFRDPLNFRKAPGFSAVRCMNALEAFRAFPGRDILLLSPDPNDCGWVEDLFDVLPAGQRVYYIDDYGEHAPVPDGFIKHQAYETRSLGERLRDLALLTRTDEPRKQRPPFRRFAW